MSKLRLVPLNDNKEVEMKLFASFSEAIREGAKLRPQTVGGFFLAGGSCGLGAAWEASYGNTLASDFSDLNCAYPYMVEGVLCPADGCVSSRSRMGIVIHLNDDHGWTREAIADWLESEEEKLGYITVIEAEHNLTAQAATTPQVRVESSLQH